MTGIQMAKPAAGVFPLSRAGEASDPPLTVLGDALAECGRHHHADRQRLADL